MSTPNPATTPWVPVWNLNGATPINYRGAWAAGTYADGDIVVQNGITYLCVRPTTNPPAPWPMAPGTSSYGTTLPASPYDGQEAVLVDLTTNPSYQWRFRYNAQSTSAYKWEFVGGSPRSSLVNAAEVCNSGSLVDLATVGPSFTLPRSGDYMLSGSWWGQGPAGSNQYGLAEICRNGASLNSPFWLIQNQITGNGYAQSALAPTLLAGAAAGDVLKFMYRIATAGQSFSARNLVVQPVRVS